MKKILLIVLCVMSLNVVGQNKTQKYFKMPSNAKYAPGHILVKIKEAYRNDITQMSGNGKSARIQNISLHSISPIAIAKSSAPANARGKMQTVDISKYFTLTFDASQNVEDYINQLYATGYFEIVEPEYKYHTSFQPNDPSIASQYYLSVIKAFDAWDITQGDTSIVVAIVDTGGNLTHSDLAPNLYRNWSEYPPNGIDDDGNGYIDDYQGWDFIGSDTANVYKSDYDQKGIVYGDNDPSISKAGDIGHGTWVAGCASAATNNGKGIAGVGYKTRLLFTKQTGDNQKASSGSEYNAFAGLLYAGDLFNRHGIRGIINCSFGGSGKSQIVQEWINHVVLDLNCLVVAAAGNDNSSSPSYPGAYDNVLSVAATDQNDVRAYFSNYGSTVDLAAPGVGIYSTGYNNVYNTVDGTSFSSPITSGAAALVWAKNPTFTAVQVGEQLRVSADATALYQANPTFVNKLGYGRLDIKRALTLELPSVRASNLKLVNQSGIAPAPGDKAFLSFDFTNYLKNTSGGIQISISSASTGIAITKNSISPGIIAGGTTISNKLNPFELTINSAVSLNTLVTIVITYADGSYSDKQTVSFYVNPSFLDVNSNQVLTTITDIGRIGFQDSQNDTRTQGSGFVFNQNSMLYEMGLIMGTSSTNIYNNVRGISTAPSGFDQDFKSLVEIKKTEPGNKSDSEIFGEFTNSTGSRVVTVDYRSMVWKSTPYDKFVIMEYQVSNPSTNALNNFYFGIFSDWDISASGLNDAAGWDNNNNMGYVYPAQGGSLPYAGIQLLTGSPAYYAIDNNSTIVGNTPWGLYNTTSGSFTDAEKFQTISATVGSGKERLQAGVLAAENGTGGDVSHVVSSGPFNIAPGQTVTIAFALHAAPNLANLQSSARYADSVYNYTLKAPKPVGGNVSVCYNSPATLNASGATTIKWYNSFTGGQAFHTGSQYVTGNLKNDTTFYVSNADNAYESVRTPIMVTTKANPTISTSRSTTLCTGDVVTLSVASSDSTIWSTGEKTNSINVQAAGKYAVRAVDNTLTCESTSDTITVVVNPKPTANFSTSGELKTQIPITFTDESTGAVQWFWDFGDGENSSDQNPVHTFSEPSSSIKLTVTSDKGCTDTKSSDISVITAIEQSNEVAIKIYPNPVKAQGLQIVIDNEDLSRAQISLVNSLGQAILSQDVSTQSTHLELTIPSSSMPDGIYIVRMKIGNQTVARKVVKTP